MANRKYWYACELKTGYVRVFAKHRIFSQYLAMSRIVSYPSVQVSGKQAMRCMSKFIDRDTKGWGVDDVVTEYLKIVGPSKDWRDA